MEPISQTPNSSEENIRTTTTPSNEGSLNLNIGNPFSNDVIAQMYVKRLLSLNENLKPFLQISKAYEAINPELNGAFQAQVREILIAKAYQAGIDESKRFDKSDEKRGPYNGKSLLEIFQAFTGLPELASIKSSQIDRSFFKGALDGTFHKNLELDGKLREQGSGPIAAPSDPAPRLAPAPPADAQERGRDISPFDSCFFHPFDKRCNDKRDDKRNHRGPFHGEEKKHRGNRRDNNFLEDRNPNRPSRGPRR